MSLSTIYTIISYYIINDTFHFRILSEASSACTLVRHAPIIPLQALMFVVSDVFVQQWMIISLQVLVFVVSNVFFLVWIALAVVAGMFTI